MHAYFLAPATRKVPIVFDVDRIRDGRSFTTRRVVAIQHGQAIFNLAASFQVAEAGPEHHDAMPDVPDARDAADDPRAARAVRRARVHRPARSATARDRRDRHASRRRAALARPEPGHAGAIPTGHVVPHADGTLPDDPLLHACIVAYASDLTLLGTAVLPHPIDRRRTPAT